VVVIAAVLFTRDPIAQQQSWHEFADERAALGISSAANVLSNLPLLLVGLWGLRFCVNALLRSTAAFSNRVEAVPWMVLFAAIAFTACGSAWYHSRPGDDSLLWDRLPLALVFTSVLGAAIAERIELRAGLLTLPVLFAFGEFSVLYWYSAGDLRYYVAVQTTAIVIVPLLTTLLPGSYTHARYWHVAVGLYLLSKLAELGDGLVFAGGGVLSGHTCKHLLAAAAGGVVLRMLQRRQPCGPAGGLPPAPIPEPGPAPEPS
jgi:hypothetical protein